jgi:16S rRNA (guanine527-N7)-methyltransferase
VEHNAGELLRFSLEAHGFDPDAFLDPLLTFCDLVAAWNRAINLTAQRSPFELASGLCADAIALASVLPTATGIVDLGSGAGFPGIPLAILRPGTDVTLVDSRERRFHFQRAAIRNLRLENVKAIRGRAEVLGPERAPLVLAQAMSRPWAAIALLARWAEVGGRLCLPVGGDVDCREWQLPTHVSTESHLRYEVKPGLRIRGLWIGRRTS